MSSGIAETDFRQDGQSTMIDIACILTGIANRQTALGIRLFGKCKRKGLAGRYYPCPPMKFYLFEMLTRHRRERHLNAAFGHGHRHIIEIGLHVRHRAQLDGKCIGCLLNAPDEAIKQLVYE